MVDVMVLPLQGAMHMKNREKSSLHDKTSQAGLHEKVIFEQSINGKVCVCQESRGD